MMPTTTKEEDDFRKYIVSRDDFRRVPRWPNDGISQNQCKEHNEFETDDADQVYLTDLFGGWKFQQKLTDMKGFANIIPCAAVMLPWGMQLQNAKEIADEETAIDHITNHYEDSDVQALLTKIGCKKAVRKATRTRSRFPGCVAILTPLFQKNLATQSNIRLLFGSELRIMHHVMEIGASIADPPPTATPAGAMWKKTLEQGGNVGVPRCEECDAVDDNRTFSKCASCKSVYYCSRDCQKSHWKLHKPECLTKQGKQVPDKVLRIAQKETQRRRDEGNQQLAKAAKEMQEFVIAETQAFIMEGTDRIDTFSSSCDGKRLRSHVTQDIDYVCKTIVRELGAELQEELYLIGKYPQGVDKSEPFRGFLFRRFSDGANFFLLREKLFADGGGGYINGNHVAGFWVVKSVQDGKALWRKLPPVGYQPGQNRFEWLVFCFTVVLAIAKPVDSGVDLGIRNVSEPNITTTMTEFGEYIDIQP